MTTTGTEPRPCASCGAELSSSALFCVECGTAVPREQRVGAATARPKAWYEKDPAAAPRPKPAPAPAATPEPPKPEPPKPEPTPEPKPAPEPTPAPKPAPRPEPKPEPKPTPEPVPAPEPLPATPPEITPGRSIEPARRPVGPRWLALAIGIGVLAVAGGVIAWVVSTRATHDVRADAVAAWQAGNAAWARGDIAAVCDTYDGIGKDGMWKDRATCMSSETTGYQEATKEQKAALLALTVDPSRTELLSTDTVVISFKEARVDGQPPKFFGPADVAVMRLTGTEWRQVGARYSGAVVGYLPATLVPTPSAIPSPGGAAPSGALNSLPVSSQPSA